MIAVIVDGADPEAAQAWSWGHEVRSFEVGDDAELLVRLSDALDRGAEVVAVQGGDRFLGRVITTHQRKLAGYTTPLRLYPLPVGPGRVAERLGQGKPFKKRARRLLRRGGRRGLKQVMTPTLEITSSAHPHTTLGFDLAVGLLFDLHEVARRGGLAGAQRLGALLGELATGVGDGPAARATIDGEPRPVASWLLASAHPRSWFELSMGGEPGARVRVGDSARALARALARSQAPVAALRGRARRLGRVHLDHLDGYVLDGELITPADPFVLQVSPGPRVHLLT